MPARFTSLGQARHALNTIIGQLQYFIWSTADKLRQESPVSIPFSAIAEVYSLKLLLGTWADSFPAFSNDPSTKMSASEVCGSKILLIQHRVAFIKTLTCLHAEESIFDQFDNEFNEILSNTEFLLSNNHLSDPYRVSLSLDMAIIEALFGTAIKCRSRSIRRRAAALLQKVTWREGVWDASIMAKIADRFIAAEEIMGDMDGISMQVPEFWRAHTSGFTIDWKTRHVKLFCNRPLDGMDKRWNEHRDFLVW
jgi:hypothetical protein